MKFTAQKINIAIVTNNSFLPTSISSKTSFPSFVSTADSQFFLADKLRSTLSIEQRSSFCQGGFRC